jgi:hypothetical protein
MIGLVFEKTSTLTRNMNYTLVLPEEHVTRMVCQCKPQAPPNLKSLTKWNIFTALVHLSMASFFIYLTGSQEDTTPLSLSNNNQEALVSIITCWNVTFQDNATNFDIKNEWIDAGSNRKSVITACIIIFHLLSAVFQGLPWFLYYHGMPVFVKYFNDVIGYNGTQVLRYTEYTFSAPLMVVAIGLSYGILDVYTLAALGALTALCMQFGLAADVMRVQARDGDDVIRTCIKPYMYYFHIVSWLTIAMPWFVIIRVFTHLLYGTYNSQCNITDDRVAEMPTVIQVLVFGECFLFALFGVVQFVQIWFYFENSTTALGKRVEWIFVLLSLFSKTSLGLLIYSSSIFT